MNIILKWARLSCITTKIRIENLNIINDYDSDMARQIVFSLGMVELVSYWKSACPPQIIVKCGALSKEDCIWWKKLYYNGLGEFFYINDIDVGFDDFVDIKSTQEMIFAPQSFNKSDLNIIPVGGGKDLLLQWRF